MTRKKTKPPPTLKDVMNPALGDTMYDTHNQFEQEWLSGKKMEGRHIVIMGSQCNYAMVVSLNLFNNAGLTSINYKIVKLFATFKMKKGLEASPRSKL